MRGFLSSIFVWFSILLIGIEADAAEPSSSGKYIAERPKVALVLSGGGAKGASHVGVLRYLQEVGIPVDMVVGTSMGSIIGAMYSLGYSPETMEEILSNIDWSYYMGDKLERTDLSYGAKMLLDKYDIDMPFGSKEIHRGFLDSMFVNAASNGKMLLNSMMPSGVISGNNILNLFYNFCIGYTDPVDFDKLPIPFACVSSDIVEDKEIIHKSGVLPLAIRASMSMPAVFNPVITGNQVLMDGGLKNNFPVDVAKEMGADIIIGVSLALEREHKAENLTSLPSQFSQLIKMYTQNKLEENKSECDILILPDMTGRTSLDFDKKTINEVISIGYNAAKDHARELKVLHDYLSEFGSTSQTYQAPKAQTLIGKEFSLSEIRIEGADSRDKDWLIRKSGLKLGTTITLADLDNAVSVFYGTKAYSRVLYVLEEDSFGDGYVVRFEMLPQKPHSLAFGIRGDSHEAMASAIRIAFNEHVFNGIQGEINGVVSYNPSFEALVSYIPRKLPRVCLSYNLHKREADIYNSDFLTDNLSYISNSFRFYLSEHMYLRSHYEFGVRYDDTYFPRALNSYYNSSLESSMKPIRTFGLFAQAHYDGLDDAYFPKNGLEAHFYAHQNLWHFRRSKTQLKPFLKLNFDSRYVWNVNEKFTFIPQFKFALNFDKYCNWSDEPFPDSFSDDMALYYFPTYQNKMGQPYADFDFEGQVSFAGLYQTHSVQNVLLAGTDVRYELFSGQFVTLKLNYARAAAFEYLFTDWMKIGDEYFRVNGLNNFGLALAYSLDTRLGPMSAEVGWNSINKKFGAFLSIGRTF